MGIGWDGILPVPLLNSPVRLAAVNRPSEIIYVLDSYGKNAPGNGTDGQKRYYVNGWIKQSAYKPDARHLETTNVLYADGHVKAKRLKDILGSSHECMWNYRLRASCP